ncbi:hypothetical protein [Bacilliculturomica massiliensis]|uniref:hypothetical protein n=1 Tax=Bacilliculturomica massiliensis TaxID=1917867 RepID=UPI001031B369|nr:hypothetical protein [Bacilliculturomica massiliensis]
MYILAGVFSGVGCILMVVFPELALSAADRGLSLFLGSVLPSLLPFFICANFMIALGVPAVIGRYFEGLFRKVFRAPGSSAFVFVISITSGYPMGAKLIGDMGRRGEISVMDGRRMLAFCTTSGPLFMLGTVGASMLGQSAAGLVIALSHYGAALLNGLLFRILLGSGPQRLPQSGGQISTQRFPGKNSSEERGLLEEFTRCILSSFQTLGVICGYIVLFTLLTDFLQFSGALNVFGAAWQKGVAKGLLEMTVGAGSIAASQGISMVMKCALCSMLISFGGISITAQSISMLSGFDVGILYYLRVKIAHGMIAFFLALALGPRLLGEAVTTGNFGGPQTVKALGSFYSLLFSVKMVIMIVILFALTCAVQNAVDLTIRSHRRRVMKREENKIRREEAARQREHLRQEQARDKELQRQTRVREKELRRRQRESEKARRQQEAENKKERRQTEGKRAEGKRAGRKKGKTRRKEGQDPGNTAGPGGGNTKKKRK